MKKNMGGLDKIVRLLVAILVVIAVYKGVVTGTLAIILVIFAAVFVLTSLVSFCPLYTLFGINTCKAKIEK
jgi:hypothetical protein